MNEWFGSFSGAASSALADVGKCALEQGHTIGELAQAMSIPLRPYRALPDAPPLCFVHIPKTAGASVAAWLRSLFPPEQIAPYVTHGEFEQLPDATEPRQYQLYAGHISGRLLRYLPRKVQPATINRDPVERAMSEYYWILEHYPTLLAANPDLVNRRSHVAQALEYLQGADPLVAVSSDMPLMRHYFRDRVLRQFAGLRGEDDDSLPDSDPVSLANLRARQLQRATKLLNAFAVVGDYSDVEGAVLLLAALRGLPAPTSLPRIHDFGAPTAETAATEAVREKVRVVSRGDFEFYELTRSKANAVRDRLQALCGEATPEAVDRHHVRSYFATAPRVLAFDSAADAPRNGSGWNLPQRDGGGKPFRRMSPGRSTSNLVLLDPSLQEYRLFCHVISSPSPQVRDALTVKAAGVPLQRVEAKWRPWNDTKALVLEWRLPQGVVAKVDGRIEFVFDLGAAPSDSELRLGKIGCVPAPPVAS